MNGCTLCPRNCDVIRKTTQDAPGSLGYCGMPLTPYLARAAVHAWEEPCISGVRGSGTVFFSGCSLKCCYCQNYEISATRLGKPVSLSRLREIYFELIQQGVHNINLVNPTHYLDAVLDSLALPLPVPVVYNSSGYEKVSSLERLAGKVQIYLPDFKYAQDHLGRAYSSAKDYPNIAAAAIKEMYRQTGDYIMDSEGILQRGVIIRHLVLPGQLDNSRRVIDWVAQHFQPGQVLFSLMFQYTPCGDLSSHPELTRRLTERECNRMEDYLMQSGIVDGFIQSREAASERYIPAFDFTGV